MYVFTTMYYATAKSLPNHICMLYNVCDSAVCP